MKAELPAAPTGERAKTLGAYYTPDAAVAFMVRWAVRDAYSKVIDPGFGNGQFLRASVTEAGVHNPSEQIYGIELDTETFTASSGILEADYRIRKLSNGDFFASDGFLEREFGQASRTFEAVVGNPPFIRYQRFKGAARTRALARAAEHGVSLPGHASSWAPFLVHAVSLIKPGGRLAMVVPAELGYAEYARNVLGYLLDSFSSLTILTFRRRLFPALSEDTFIVLGEERSGAAAGQARHLTLIDIESQEKLGDYGKELTALGESRTLEPQDLDSLRRRETKLLEHLLPDDVRRLYARAREAADARSAIRRLGRVAQVGIGYVTGDNAFFHPSPEDAERFGLEPYLEPCVRRGGSLRGLAVTRADWERDPEPSKRLLAIPPDTPWDALPDGVRGYLERGVAQGVLRRYKVQSRTPWYAVPRLERADALLTYMAGHGPRLVHNPEGWLAPNTLHVVRVAAGVDARLLAVAWHTSLTFLSAELEGRSLGGGMLKLEPSEARRVVVALPPVATDALEAAHDRMDAHLRAGDLEAALDVGDALILRAGLGYSAACCARLRAGYRHLRDRRRSR